MEPNINPKLSHLSESQIQTLIDRYYCNDKIHVLLREYMIDCLPNQLHRLFPTEILSGHNCPYCAAPMVRERPSRSSLRYKKPNIRCPICWHREGGRFCGCMHCVEEERRKKQIQQEAVSANIRSFCQTTWPASPHQPAAEDLNLRTAVALLALSRACQFVDGDVSNNSPPSYLALESLAHATVPFSPKGDLGRSLLDELMMQGLIGISELSSTDAFEFEHGELRACYPTKVRWTVTVEDPERLLEEITLLADDNSKWPSHWSPDIKDLWLEIGMAECKEYFRYAAEERGLPEAGKKSTDAMLANLLRDFSVAQCYRIIWGGAQRAADFLVRKHCSKQHAANYMIGECQRWADRARADKWEVKYFKRNFDLPRCSLSYVFFDLFLKIGEDGFNLVTATLDR